MVGGSCPNVACLPSKNVIHSAKAIARPIQAVGLGVTTGQVRADMAGVARRKRKMVDELVEIHLGNYRSSGAELVMGEARFTEPKTVEVTLNAGGTRHAAGRACLHERRHPRHCSRRARTGSRRADDARRSPEPGTPARPPRHPRRRLRRPGIRPGHAAFGSRVTIIQRGPRLLDREDPDVAEALLELLKDEGVEVLLRARGAGRHGPFGHGRHAPGASGDGEDARSLRRPRGGRAYAQHRPNGRGPKAGVELDGRGYVRVNERPPGDSRRTSGPWASAPEPAVHARGRGRFRVVLEQSRRRQPDHPRPAHSAIACSPTRNWPTSA